MSVIKIAILQIKYISDEEEHMPRQKKNNVPVSFRLEKEIFDRLEQFCEDSGQSKTVAVERALDGYFRQYYQNTQMDETNKGIISNCESE